MSEHNQPPRINVSLSAVEQRVRISAFRALYQGKTPSASDLAEDINIGVSDIDAAIAALIDVGLMTVDETGFVTGSHGMSILPSDHRVIFDIGERFVWCAVDAVGIPAAMRIDAQVESRCFHCSEPVGLTIRRGEPQAPASEILRIGLGTAGCTGKVIEDVCPMLNFFCGQEHAERWAEGVGGANVITIQQAAEIGRREWADVID